MQAVNLARSYVVDSSVKESVKDKLKNFGGMIKGLSPADREAMKYGQMPQGEGEGEAQEQRLNPDGTPILKQGKFYKGNGGCCSSFVATKRYYLAWMSSFGFMITFGIRCNLSVAMVALTSGNFSKALDPQVPGPMHVSQQAPDAVMWPAKVRGIVDASFFYGYLITQVPGGIIAAKFPANRLFGIAVGGSSIINLLMPTMVKSHWAAVIFFRICQGLVEGTSYPACHGIWRYWAPQLERSRLATIAFCGSYAGAVFGIFLSGWLTSVIHWRAPFYLYSVIGLIWFAIWWRTTYEKPSDHPYISQEEREYIESSIGHQPGVLEQKIAIPWRAFATSLPVYAIIVANIARSWSFYLLIMKMVKYYREVHQEELTESGFLAALPHCLMAIIVPIGGQLADRLRKNVMSTTNVRKLFNCGGFGMEAVFMMGLAYSHSLLSANVCMNLAVAFSGFAISGYNVNHLDIAPRYASILMGLSNGMGTISGMLVPVVTEMLTKNKNDPSAWTKVFVIAASIHFVGITFYGLFASGELQPWAEPPEESQGFQPPTESTPEQLQGYSYGGTVDQSINYAPTMQQPQYQQSLYEQPDANGSYMMPTQPQQYVEQASYSTHDPYHQPY